MAAPSDKTRDWRDTVFLPKTDFPMKAGLAAKEPAIQACWEATGLYEQIRAARAGAEKFILHDGPPYANGDMHIGHALNHILKDAVIRTQTLLGKDAPYVPGWDCHGLPIEWKVEEQYRAKKRNKDEVPLPEFRAECRAYAQHWVDRQREQLKRLGIGGDWDDPYLTMAYAAEATIVAELHRFVESGQVYRGARPVMWSPVEKTALAEAEVEYHDVTSTQIDVAFEIVESPVPELVGAYAVIWTTTPWTIPVNQAIAYGAEDQYKLYTIVVSVDVRPGVDVFDDPSVNALNYKKVILAADDALRADFELRMREYWPGAGLVDAGWQGIGADLVGTLARHPMYARGGFFATPRRLLAGDFVTTDAGTGLVHMAPDHGEDDFALCKAHGIEPVFAVEGDGRYRADWAWLGGQGSVIAPKFNAPDGPICSDLRGAGALLAADAFQHSYPHSWRSKARVIYRATPQWFIAMDKPLEGDGATLRARALDAIAATRFVPDKGRNRIGAMVTGRPDWVISRQRAWGVPIALFVDRRTGAPLVDPAVNARIAAAIRERGVDAWSDEAMAELLGAGRDPADYERVTDILDVWFDSGCTHAFVLESGRWPALAWPADLYLEGSDQHRGWFQSSLLESCGTRGRAPYKAVLTHGFTMDAKGMKMSKSLGNTVDPIAVAGEHGADILRLWALSIDFTEDHRIGKEILAGTSDAYRKLRNTFRYLLGALDGFGEDERTALGEMPELERYVLHRLALLDDELRAAAEGFEFGRYTRALTDFCNADLSAFYFDIRKDVLYCDVGPARPEGTAARRACRTVLDILFHALVRYAAPILCFTAEEVWGTRLPEAGSVHLLTWPETDGLWINAALAAEWEQLRALRAAVSAEIEPKRKAKELGSSLEAKVAIGMPQRPGATPSELAALFIVSDVVLEETVHGPTVIVHRTDWQKCGRCWRHLPEVGDDGELCGRCEAMVHD